MSKILRELNARHDMAKGLRYNHEAAWQEIMDLMMPFRGDITFRQQIGGSRRINKPIFDSTAMQSRDAFLNFIKGELFPSTDSSWVGYLPPKRFRQNHEVMVRLEDTGERVLAALGASNFYVASTSALADMSGIGNSVFQVDIDRGDLTFDAISMRDSWWLTGKGNKPWFYIRSLRMAAMDVERQFAKDLRENPDARAVVNQLLADSPAEEVELRHFVHRNENFLPDLGKNIRHNSRKKWISHWVLDEGLKKPSHLLRSSGFDYMPYVISRWSTVEGESYGRGRGHLTRPDAKGVNALTGRVWKSMDREISPPLLVSSKDQIRMNFGPNSRPVVRDGIPPQYLTSGARFDLANAVIEQNRDAIRKGWMSEALDHPGTEPRSAFESRARIARVTRRLASSGEAVANEFLDPVISAVTHLLSNEGRLPELQEAIEIMNEEGVGSNEEVAIQYTSPFFVAQRSSELGALRSFLADRLDRFQGTQDPAWLDDLDVDQIRLYEQEVLGINPKLFRDEDAVNERRRARADQASLTQQLEAAQAAGTGGLGEARAVGQ